MISLWNDDSKITFIKWFVRMVDVVSMVFWYALDATFTAPMIIMAEINIVMHKLKTMTILTTDGGRKSNRMVLKWARTVNTIMIVTMDIRIDATPVMIEPARNVIQRQHVFNNGSGIFQCFQNISAKKQIKIRNRSLHWKIIHVLRFEQSKILIHNFVQLCSVHFIAENVL